MPQHDVNKFRGCIAVEAAPSLDGRTLEAGSVWWDPHRLNPAADEPGMTVFATESGSGDRLFDPVGAVNGMWREGNEIHAEGVTSLPPGEYTGGIGVHFGEPIKFIGETQMIIPDAEVYAFHVHDRPTWPQVRITVEAGNGVAGGPCEAFQWVGQSFASCDGCGRPYWEHSHIEQAGEGSGPFAPEWVRVPITAEDAYQVRRKWEQL
jgi:hypothetical protein